MIAYLQWLLVIVATISAIGSFQDDVRDSRSSVAMFISSAILLITVFYIFDWLHIYKVVCYN